MTFSLVRRPTQSSAVAHRPRTVTQRSVRVGTCFCVVRGRVGETPSHSLVVEFTKNCEARGVNRCPRQMSTSTYVGFKNQSAAPSRNFAGGSFTSFPTPSNSSRSAYRPFVSTARSWPASPRLDHLSYLPFSGSVLSELASELDGYTMTKSALHFPIDQPLPTDLVKRLTEVRRSRPYLQPNR